MRFSLGFFICFTFLLLLTLVPAGIGWNRLNHRIYVALHQREVDSKRIQLEEMQTRLREVCAELSADFPSDGAVKIKDLEKKAPSSALANILVGQGDKPGQLTLIDSDHEVLNLFLSMGEMQNWSHQPDPSKAMTRACGNVIRGFNGYSLVWYENLDRKPVYGAWMWDRQHQLGMILELPAYVIDQSVEKQIGSSRTGWRIVQIAAVGGYLIAVGVIVLLIQRWMVKSGKD